MRQYWLTLRKAAWEDRLPRERRAIGLAAVILLPLLAYFVLWQPAHRAVARLRPALPLMRMQAAHMHRQASEVETLRQRSQPATLDALALKNVVEASAERAQLHTAMEQLEPLEPNSVRIAFSSVSFAQWLKWVGMLQQEQHIRVDSADIVALSSAGKVRINATLTNGTAH